MLGDGCVGMLSPKMSWTVGQVPVVGGHWLGNGVHVDELAHDDVEEAGVAATTMTPKGFIYTTPGFTDEKIWLFEARGLVPSREYEKDADEVIEVIDVTTDELDAMVENGTICDAKTICLIHRCCGDA